MEQEQIEEILNTLSDKLSIPLSHLWEVMIVGIRMQGIIEIACICITIIICIIPTYLVYKTVRKKVENTYYGLETVMISVSILFIWFFTVIILMSLIADSSTRIIAPEYSVIQSILF